MRGFLCLVLAVVLSVVGLGACVDTAEAGGFARLAIVQPVQRVVVPRQRFVIAQPQALFVPQGLAVQQLVVPQRIFTPQAFSVQQQFVAPLGVRSFSLPLSTGCGAFLVR